MSKNVKDCFDALAPTESQIDNIYNRISQKQETSSHYFSFKRYALVGSIILVMLCAGSIVLYLNWNHNKPDNNQQASMKQNPVVKPEDKLGETTNPVNTEKSAFGGFVVTTYITEESQKYLSGNFIEESKGSILVPNTKLLLADYELTSSMTPGLPFTFELNNSDEMVTLKVEVDHGEFLTWDSKSGKVSKVGALAICAIGDTLFWSPTLADSEDIGISSNATIKITALEEDTIIATQEIHITESDDRYYAELGELAILAK